MNERRPRVIEPVYSGYKSHQEAEAADRAWWHSLTPQERLAHLEIARQYAYGSEMFDRRLSRVPEMSQRRRR
ncbi:MAG TPA: hypothetical protein VIK53_05310 [Verrucomicrobiae bacterium]